MTSAAPSSFEAITELDEYYLTRTEISILKKDLPEMAARVGPNATVIEFGTGAGIKTKMLLEALVRPCAYIPIDISREQLAIASTELVKQFPNIDVHPIFADYTSKIMLPIALDSGRESYLFPRFDDWEFYAGRSYSISSKRCPTYPFGWLAAHRLRSGEGCSRAGISV